MKKITLIAALLGSFYFANAQVGIGTSSPATASYLDVTSSNKGILIPRVSLTDLSNFDPITGSEVESLLVYNTNTVVGATGVSPGFYYWVIERGAVAAHWERVINQSQLDEVIGNLPSLQENVQKMLTLLQTAYPSSDLFTPAVTGDTFGGGMFFTPGSPPAIEYIYFDGTNYVKKNIIADLGNIVRGAESETLFVSTTTPNAPVNQYFLSEAYMQTVTDPATGVVTPPTQAVINAWTPGTLPAGVFTINMVTGVSSNFEAILSSPTTIVKTTTPTTTYYTVQEYIEYLSQNSMESGVTKIVDDGSGNAAFQTWNSATNTWDAVANDQFKKIVTDNETITSVGKSQDNAAYVAVTADPKALDKIVYEYITENQTVRNYVDVTADVEWSIENNADVRTAIEEILNTLLSQGGNVYFTRTAIAADASAGQLAIPAFSFYTVNAAGVKELADITQTIINAITNATPEQKQEIKNQLGDNFSNTTLVNTGDTWIDGGLIYKGIFTATIAQGTANVSAISLTPPAGTQVGDVITIKIFNAATNNIINTATTDVALNASVVLTFKIGTGNWYQVLPEALAGNFNIKVVVDFSAAP